MKSIGIVTFHSSHNCGSALIAYAMSRVLESFGLEARIIDFRHPASIKAYEFSLWDREKPLKSNIYNLIYKGILGRGRKGRKAYHIFANKYLPLTQRYRSGADIKEHFDYLVCGSDQIWNPDAPDSRDMIYFLNFGAEGTVKFSYAASSGGRSFRKEDRGRAASLLSSFKQIGVREQSLQNYLKSEFNLDSIVNPDPTLLLTSGEWEKIMTPVGGLPENYLLVYSLLNFTETVEFASDIAYKLNLTVVHINHRLNVSRNKCEGADITLFDISPTQFLWLFRHAAFVVSNSFHGNMFSIIFRKDFICPVFDFKDTRIENLHERVGLERSRLVESATEFSPDCKHIDYTVLEEKIERFRKEGFDFIKECL